MMTLTKDDLLAIEGVFAGKFENIDRRLDKIEGCMDNLEGCMDNLEGRMDSLEGRMDNLEGRMDNLEGCMDNLDGRIEHVESDVSSLKVGQIQLSKKLNEVALKVDSTYKLALENWGQIEESKTRLALLEN